MYFRKLISICMPAVCLLLVLLTPSLPFTFASTRSKRSSALPRQPRIKQQQRTKLQSFRLGSMPSRESTENELPAKEIGQPPSSSLHIGTATIPEEVFNLVKSIIGAGAFSLPAGVALMGSNGSGMKSTLGISFVLVAVMGSISAYTFSMIARVCKMTNSKTYSDCWQATRGRSLAWIVALSSTLDCFAGNLTFSMVLADTFRQLLSALFKLGGSTTNYPAVFAAMESFSSRSRVLLVLTATLLIPLCCVKNMSTLAPFSLIGILGMVYTAIVIALRYVDGSYGVPGGRFLADLDAVPSFNAEGASLLLPLKNPKALILVSILSTAYIAHFNAPKFYRELKDSDTRPERFHVGVVASSFAVSMLFYFLISSLGYLTFGSATKGMLLSNYSTNDVLISLSRFAVGLSLIFSYPLLFVGLRDGIVDLINQVSPLLFPKTDATQPKKLELTDSQSNRLTVGLVSLITIMALKISNLTFVASLSGALLGSSLIFIFPPLMFRSAVIMESDRTNTPLTKLQKLERRICSVIIGLGVLIAGLGAKMAWTA